MSDPKTVRFSAYDGAMNFDLPLYKPLTRKQLLECIAFMTRYYDRKVEIGVRA